MNGTERLQARGTRAVIRPWAIGALAAFCIPWAIFDATTQSTITRPSVVVDQEPRRTEPRVLHPSDFELIGAMKVPHDVGGYGRALLAMRRVDEQMRFLITGNRLDNDPVLEVDVAGFARERDDAPRATLLRRWGDIYEGRKHIANAANAAWTEDLEWFDGRLYWVYGDSYNVAGTHNPSIGFTMLDDQPYGPWRTEEHSHLTQGYITTVPRWYADRYLEGQRLAVGSGLKSGNIRSSWGPSLVAVDVPTPSTPTNRRLKTTTLVQYSFDHRLDRERSYIPLTRPPDLAGGWWTQQDWIYGAVWVDLPDKHGVIFFGTLAAGHVWYGGQEANDSVRDPCGDWQGPHAERYDRRWWIYDPARFAPVSHSRPHDVRPSSVFDPDEIAPTARNCLGETTGGVFDPATRTLYVVNLEAEPVEDELNLPVIYAYRIR